MPNNELPYIEEEVVKLVQRYNPKYGDERICRCSHIYYRHFDSYEKMLAIGCKYCSCYKFIEAAENA